MKSMKPSFAKSALLMFLALRAGDFVSVAAGMWFVPRYVSADEIGAVLPLTSFATLLSLPVFALAMAVMRETACLAADGDRGRIKSLLRGVFIATAVATAVLVASVWSLVPRFTAAMNVPSLSAGALAAAAALLGCAAPVYTDALQSLKRFIPLACIEAGGAVARAAVLVLAMPIVPLAGYFAGQAALPLFRIGASVAALRRDLRVASAPYWNRAAAGRLALAFLAILAYQAFPMAASLVEQTVLRTSLAQVDSAGFYMASRFSDFLNYLTYPLLLVMFPFAAESARRGGSTHMFVIKCSAVTLAAAALAAAAYARFGANLLSLMPHGADYADYSRLMPLLTISTALTACQVFYTNAEVSAGRFSFLLWFVPLHAVYPAALLAAARVRAPGLDGMVWWFTAASAARFLFASAAVAISRVRRASLSSTCLCAA